MEFRETPHFTLYTVADGVYAAIVKQGSGAFGNAAIVDLGDQTLVFDTFFTPTAARVLRQVAEEITGRPATYALNSHRHTDHVFGNVVFRDVPIIATLTTRALIAERGPAFVETMQDDSVAYLQKTEAEIASLTDPRHIRDLTGYISDLRVFVEKDLAGYELVLPTLTFAEQISFYGSHRTAHFIDYGANHTPSDAVLYLPDDSILVAGDIVQTRFHPSMGQGDHLNWVESMTKLEALHIRHVIPGHGDVSDGSAMTRMKEYLTTIITDAESAVARGLTPEAAAQEQTPAQYSDYGWFTGYQDNLAALIGVMSADTT